MRHLLQLIACTILLTVIAACSNAADLEVTSGVEPTTTEQALSETIPTTVAPVVQSTLGSTPESMAFDESDIEFFEYRAPTSPEAPGCVAATALLSDPSFQASDARMREAALIDATSDILGGAEDAWLAIRDERLAETDDLEMRFAKMQTASDSGNQLNRITWEACGLPILQIDLLLTRGCSPSFNCDEPDIWAEVLPCFHMERFTMELFPGMSLENENYLPIDCSTATRIELDRDGTWMAKRTQEELARLITAWVVESDIAAGTSSAQALADGQLVQQGVDLDFADPRMIVEPTIELPGLVAARDLPDGHILVAGDFVNP